LTFLVDTCVLSEAVRPRPARSVIEWLDAQNEASLYISALTLAELQRGVSRLPSSRKRKALEVWLHDELPRRFERRVLPVDLEVALAWGRAQAAAEKRGRRVPVLDGLIAATALANDLIVVTRNGEHMAPTGAEILDPWGGDDPGGHQVRPTLPR
jgi:predicted nucleic acid-binding protein